MHVVYFATMNTPVVMTETTSQDAPREESRGSFALYVILALGLALLIRSFIAAPYIVSGSSMENTFFGGDYLITDRFSYRMNPPERGDVVVFCLPSSDPCAFSERIQAGLWTPPRTLIKRIIGLPGETITVNAAGVSVSNAEHPEGLVLSEPYLSPENLGGPSNITVTLDAGEYFVLGDNRRVSSDSRTWGALPQENIIGGVFVRLFPFSQIGIRPGNATYDTR